ncbi:MAG TPA: thioredoxin domain-containing protein [Solirubrobacterales bacterium]|nr:thioredoxin domain-containing protein [Solirubrobacterales bacterium]
MSDDAAGKEANRQRLLKLASAAAFLAIVVVAVLIVVNETQTEGGDTEIEGAAAITGQLGGIPQRGLVLGDPNARVTLVEYGDLQCPVCKAYAEEIVPEMIESKVRSGEARIEFRNFVILGEDSATAGAAAIAAGRQGRGWQFVELFYRNQGFEGSGYVTDDFLTAIAEGAEVPDVARWNRERRSRGVVAELSRTTAEAEGLGLGGTPSFAIAGPGARGLQPIDVESAEDLKAAVERAAQPQPVGASTVDLLLALRPLSGAGVLDPLPDT